MIAVEGMNQEIHYEDELSLADILKVIKTYRRSILLVPLFLAVFAVIFSVLFIKPSYRASATIQVGQVGQVGQAGPKLLESGLVVETRLKEKFFISNLIATNPSLFNHEGEIGAEQGYLEKGLDVKKNKDTELVSFSILGRSPELARQNAEALFKSLRDVHSSIYDERVAMTRQQVDLIDAQINSLKQEISRLKLSVGSSRGLSSYNAVVDSILGGDQETQLRNLKARKLELEVSLNAAETFNTKLFGGVYVSNAPESPRLVLIALVAALIGLFGAIFAAFVADSLKRSTK